MNNQAVIEIRNLEKSYINKGKSHAVLSCLSFGIQPGEIICVVGPSGCGKSTLLHILGGFDKAYSGEVLFLGKPVDSPSSDKAVIFQSSQLFPWLTVEENIGFGLKRAKVNRQEQEERTLHYLNEIEMMEYKDFYPDQISGGMKQRVALARALILNPRLLLMDEPFSALDYQLRLLMQQRLLKLWEETKPAIFFVTHDIEEAILISDRIFVLSGQPSGLTEIIKNPFERPRDLKVLRDPRFAELKSRIFMQLGLNLD